MSKTDKSEVQYKKRELEVSEDRGDLGDIHAVLHPLLYARGIVSEADARDFFDPSYGDHLHDYNLMPDMKIAVERILKALAAGERICVYTDYDADGVPAAVVLTDFFRRIKFENYRVYIPHRGREGFGLHADAVENLAADDVSLIVTLDCGSTDHEAVQKANTLGIDVIITDHHSTDKTLPAAFAIVNPKRIDSEYPFNELSGTGVAFKLVQALIEAGNKSKQFSVSPEWEKWLLDMVAVATVGDMVPLVDENRVLVLYGLKVLRQTKRVGLRTIIKNARRKQDQLTEDDIGFAIAPRINAASRMGDARLAFDVLSCSDPLKARGLAQELEEINTQRRALVASAMKQARKLMKERLDDEVIVVGDPNWRPGIVGLIAGTLANTYEKPVFVWGREDIDSPIKGSCRSVKDFNIVELMRSVSDDIFANRGGHAQAGGFTLAESGVHTMRSALNEAYAKIKAQETDSKEHDETEITIDYDLDIKAGELSGEILEQIVKLAPYGIGNPKPRFRLISEKYEIQNLGASGKYSQIKLFEGELSRVITFSLNEEKLKDFLEREASCLDCIIEIDRDSYNGGYNGRLIHN